MPANRIETVDFQQPGELAWSAARLLLAQGHGAQWPPCSPDDLDVLAFIEDIESEDEHVYAVVESETGIVMAAAHAIHGSTVCLTSGRLDQRVPPYTYLVNHAVEAYGDYEATERALISHVADQALALGDKTVAVTTVDYDLANTLASFGFMGDIDVMGAPVAHVIAKCAPMNGSES